MSGIFISIEGIEGSGKSSLITSLAEWLRARGEDVLLTREPGGTAIGSKIRELLLKETNPPPSSTTELLLFSADRSQHVTQVLRPALSEGKLILCDRYVHSTYAYQGYGRDVPLNRLRSLSELATGGLLPDIVLLLDLPAEAGLARAKSRAVGNSTGEKNSESWTRFEAEELDFHRRVRDGFLKLASEDPGRFVILDASAEKNAVRAAAERELAGRLQR